MVIVTVVLDQLAKQIVLHDIGLNNSKDFIPNLINLTVVKNTGGAFSILSQYPIYFKIIGVINVFIFLYLTFCPTVRLNTLVKIGSAFILGGCVGNLIDRFVIGAVIDFIDLQFINFAVFNLADVFIDLGAGLILIGWLYQKKIK